MSEPLVAFVTALDVEARAVGKLVGGQFVVERTLSNVTITRGKLATGDATTIEVALVISGPGNVAAAGVVSQLIGDWPNAYFVFVGIAGGRSDEVAIGDVVVPTRVYAPQQGKETPTRFAPRSHTPALTRDMETLVRQVIAAGKWTALAPKWENRTPKAFVKPIASSDVIDTSGASQLELVLGEHFDDAYAVETEGYGFLAELATRSRRGVLVRGISDLCKGKDAKRDAAAQPVAAEIAATLAVEIVRAGIQSGVIARPALTSAASRLVRIVRAIAGTPVPLERLAAGLVSGGLSGSAVIDEATSGETLSLRLERRIRVATADKSSPLESVPVADLSFAIDTLVAQLDDRPSARLFLAAAIELARVVLHADPVRVIGFFDRVEKAAKRAGSLRLVMEAARISVLAAQRGDRGTADVAAEAKALICGTSWVYQRIGMLPEALADGQRSLELGQQINWHRNTFYCEKCLGRFERLRAESLPASERPDALRRSVERLQRAIIGFEHLEGFGAGDPEVGDCHSLLGRTYLMMGEHEGARENARIAQALLTDS